MIMLLLRVFNQLWYNNTKDLRECLIRYILSYNMNNLTINMGGGI